MIVRLGPHQMLSRDQQATLVVAALDALWFQIRDEETGCCPRCCGSCKVIAELAADDTLDHVLLQATPAQRNSQWWDEDEECVDADWLAWAWSISSCPEHGPYRTQQTP